MSFRPIRVLFAKPGLDSRDRGLGALAGALRDSGMEVIYLGIRQTPEVISRAALEEDVDVVTLNVAQGAHMAFFPAVLGRLRESGQQALLTGTGMIPEDEKRELQTMGVGRLFDVESPARELADYIRAWFESRRDEKASPPTRPSS